MEDGDIIVEVPPAIVDRLMNYSSQFTGGVLGSNPTSIRITCYIKYDNGKYYLCTGATITYQAETFIWSIYYLKDI